MLIDGGYSPYRKGVQFDRYAGARGPRGTRPGLCPRRQFSGPPVAFQETRRPAVREKRASRSVGSCARSTDDRFGPYGWAFRYRYFDIAIRPRRSVRPLWSAPVAAVDGPCVASGPGRLVDAAQTGEAASGMRKAPVAFTTGALGFGQDLPSRPLPVARAGGIGCPRMQRAPWGLGRIRAKRDGLECDQRGSGLRHQRRLSRRGAFLRGSPQRQVYSAPRLDGTARARPS